MLLKFGAVDFEAKVYVNGHAVGGYKGGYTPFELDVQLDSKKIRKDLEWTKKFGFNGARKHQKIEDPRYYYWADKMGVLVWGEVPSPFAYTDETVENLFATLLEFIRSDFNHPCIITWVPLNESWGVPQIISNERQRMTASMLYYMTKAAALWVCVVWQGGS